MKVFETISTYLFNRGNSPSTIALRFRCLRIMYNYAVKKGFISNKYYPFRKFNMSSSAKSKKVLYPQQLKALFEYVPKTLREDRAKDYLFFCFLCNGMNFKDTAYLKRSQINQNTLTFVRQKTKNTTHDTQEIQVYLHDEVKRIISKWGNKDISPDAYLFPILPSKFISIERNEATRSIHQRRVNKSLIAIGKSLEFDINITINLARHSFATTLKLNGTHVSFISELLGHTNVKTTMHYLKTIPGEELKAISDSLLQFG
jgi:integrase/recombinase XerD